jgi:hypothetical protein|tara:strand:- start:1111 stop:1344 length:234 start_codon:yes stop_codon:yes gene_type:complete
MEGNSQITIDVVGDTTLVDVKFKGSPSNGVNNDDGIDITSIEINDTRIDPSLVKKLQKDVDTNLEYFTDQIKDRNYA